MAQCIGVLYEAVPLEFECSKGAACDVADLIETVRADPGRAEQDAAQEIRDAHPERVPPDVVTEPHA